MLTLRLVRASFSDAAVFDRHLHINEIHIFLCQGVHEAIAACFVDRDSDGERLIGQFEKVC